MTQPTRRSRWLLLVALAAGLTGCAREPRLLGFTDEAQITGLLEEVEAALPELETAAREGAAAKAAGDDTANATLDPAYSQAVDLRGRLAPLAYSTRAAEPRIAGLWERLRAVERELLRAELTAPRGGAIQYPPGVGQYFFRFRVLAPLEGGAYWLMLLATVVVFFALLAGLQRLGSAARRQLTVVCTFLAGLFYIVAFFWPQASNPVKAYETPLGSFNLAMGAFTVGLGVINLCSLHGRTLLRGGAGRINSVAFFLGFLGMIVCGFWQNSQPPAEGPTMTAAAAGYGILFNGLLKPLQATTFSLLGFFIVSAAYRAFRIRNTEAALMTIIAFTVMLGQVPVGQALTAWLPLDGPLSWLRLENLTNWLLTTPNAAAFRGILFGSVIGGFALSLRVWLSLERGSYFGKEF